METGDQQPATCKNIILRPDYITLLTSGVGWMGDSRASSSRPLCFLFCRPQTTEHMLSVLICKDKLLKCFPCSRHPSFIHLYFWMWQTAKTFRRLWKLYKWCYCSSQNGGVSGPAAWKHGQSFLIKPMWSTLFTRLSRRVIKRTHCVRISGE